MTTRIAASASALAALTLAAALLAPVAGPAAALARDYAACGEGVSLGDDAGVARALDAVSAAAPSAVDACVVAFMREEHAEALENDDRFKPAPETSDVAAWADLLYCKALSWSLMQAAIDARATGGETPDYVGYGAVERAGRASAIDQNAPTRRDICFLQHGLARAGALKPADIDGRVGPTFIKAVERVADRSQEGDAAAVASAVEWVLAQSATGGVNGAEFAGCAALLRSLSPEIRPLAAPPDGDRDYARMSVRRALAGAGPVCFGERRFREAGRDWRLIYALSADRPDGPRFALPHDNEDAALDSALYAMGRYGGGFVAVEAGESRLFQGQDPNRAFGPTARDSAACRQLGAPHPVYTAAVMDLFRGARWPVMALHTNADGWSGNGGQGTISVQRRSSVMQPHVAINPIGRLRDEDNAVLTAGIGDMRANAVAQRLVGRLTSWGVNVIYEAVKGAGNDCSLSNYVLLNGLAPRGYVNIEAEDGDSASQRAMIDFALQAIAQAQ